jgi:signal peptidase I
VTRGEPARGDIVVFWSPVDARRLVKRVVGVPGDVVTVRDGQVSVNGRPARYEAADLRSRLGDRVDTRTVALETLDGRTHPVMASAGWPAGTGFGPARVPAGSYFVMGDHRDMSFDSRFWGYVDRDRIIGRARAVVGSLDPERSWRPRWSRFLTGLS